MAMAAERQRTLALSSHLLDDVTQIGDHLVIVGTAGSGARATSPS